MVKEDVCGFVNDFHLTSVLPEAITTSFLTLIPKVDNLGSFDDYRPIFLICSLYKFFAKLPSNRLRLVVGKLISLIQPTFVPNRNMLDEVLVINEILDHAKKSNRICMLVKVDFEKAYNCVSWFFLGICW